MTLTDTQLAEIRERADKATPGPWTERGRPTDDWGYVRCANVDEDGFQPVIATTRAGHRVTDEDYAQHRRDGTDPYAHNAAFIAHARTDVPDLLSHIAFLDSQLSTIRKEATDAEREACALIADDFERTAESFGGAHAKIAEGTAWGIAQAIRAPTGDEGK